EGGQGDQVRRHQAGVMAPRLRITPVPRTAVCPAACRPTARFRTIQAYPKDLRALPVHPEPAVSWHSGFRGGAHARPKTTSVHHAAWRRCGRVAARGARAAARADAARRCTDEWRRHRDGTAVVCGGVRPGAPPSATWDGWTV